MSNEYQPKILIVDDDITIRMAMRMVLENHAFDVTEAADGQEAVEQFDLINPDMVILDIEMPIKDGLAACEEIRTREKGQLVPILMSTGMDDVASINRAYEAGATDFIVKPINWPIFGHRIRYMMRAAQAMTDFANAEQLAARLGKVIETSSNEIYIAEYQSLTLRQVNASARVNSRYDESELYNLTLTEMLPEFDRDKLQELLSNLALNSRPEASFTTKIQRKDKTTYPAEIRLQISRSDKETLVVAIAQDITERKEAEDRMRQLAYYDSLTGLPNRQLFSEQLELMLKLAQRAEYKIAVLFIDLDNFKRINDSLGHSAGDELLKEIGERLTQCVRESDLVSRYVDTETEISVSRLGGDEFTVVLNQIEDSEAASVVAKRLLTALSRSINLKGHDVVVTPSIGIAIAPLDSDDVESLLKHADTAMYHAKNAGKNNYKYYSSAMNAMGVERLRLESELRRALKNDEFVVYYQPQVDIRTGEISGAEAMVRWQHPEHGIVGPDSFIPLAEEMGLIVELGDKVLYEACMQVKTWQDKGLKLDKIAVNLSSLQFKQSDLIARTQKALDETGLSPTCLELELTEGIIMSNVQTTITALRNIKEMGISLSVDDFGTGYSSLNYLKRFPLDELKIDKSFVIDVDKDQHNAGIVTAIVAMADTLGLNIVAEGVETQSQLKFLQDQGVVIVQGFLFSKPVPAAEFEAHLTDNQFSRHLNFIDDEPVRIVGNG